MKRLLFLTAFLCLIFHINAQEKEFITSTTSIEILRNISPNGKYAVGTVNGAAFLWDVDANTITTLSASATYQPGGGYAVTDNGVVAATFPDSNYIIQYVNNYGETITEPIISGGVWQNGQWTSIGLGAFSGSTPGPSDGSFIYGITSDGRTVVGNSKNYISGRQVAYPYSWTNNNSSWEGKTWSQPENVRQGSSIMSISGNGSTAAGWTQTDETEGIREGIIWKSPTDYQLIPFEDHKLGDFRTISRNGKYAAFTYAQQGGLYDIENDTYTLFNLGGNSTVPYAISNNGVIVGSYVLTNITGRQISRGFIWSKDLGFLDFSEFLEEYLSDLDIPFEFQSAFSPSGEFSLGGITPDGLIFAGNARVGRIVRPFMVKLSEAVVILPRPTNLTTKVDRIARNKVVLTWTAPESSTENLTGYVIYRDNEAIDTISSSLLTYTEEDVPAGYYYYRVKALYESGSSGRSEGVRTTIVDSYNLPFYENFDSTSLETNYWTTQNIEGRSSWIAYAGAGVEGGTGLGLEVTHSQDTFITVLISKPLDARNAENVYLSFMVFLRDPIHTPDILSIDISEDGTSWETAKQFYFAENSLMDWRSELVDITKLAKGKIINIRFRLRGGNTSIDTKFYFFDDIKVTTTLPDGEAIPQDITIFDRGENITIAWQDPSGLYGITEMKTPVKSMFGNEGVAFIAAQSFTAKELAVFNNMYLSSISVYLYNHPDSSDGNFTLRLAVFEDGQRINSTEITQYNLNQWNTFSLDNPIHISNINELKIGIEVVQHQQNERPIGADEDNRGEKGKGDLYSEDNGVTWKKLSDTEGSGFNRNWAIIGNITPAQRTTAERTTYILGYNVFRDGVKLNNDLIYGQRLNTTKYKGCYSVRAYSLVSGLSGASREECIDGPIAGIENPSNANDIVIYPNPAKSILHIEGNAKNILIYDINGQIVLKAENQNTLSIGHLSNGVYILSLENDKGRSVQKLIIQK